MGEVAPPGGVGERKEEDEKVALVRLVGLVGPVIYEESVSKGLLVYTSV
jgi:hypothetical protein